MAKQTRVAPEPPERPEEHIEPAAPPEPSEPALLVYQKRLNKALLRLDKDRDQLMVFYEEEVRQAREEYVRSQTE